MGGKRTEAKCIGEITSELSDNTLALRTIDFVSLQLPAWRDDPNRPAEESEKKLNPQLCKFLDSRARHDFPMVRFDHEEPQSGRRSVDLSASLVDAMLLEARFHTIYDPILVLEGKRLPAPSSDREKEYVTGNEDKTGGIQRFKLGLHGAQLNLSAMIGYVQAHAARYWHDKINGWISELASGTIADVCVWNANETLERLEEDTEMRVARYRSVHNRTTGTEIELHHLWIVMNR